LSVIQSSKQRHGSRVQELEHILNSVPQIIWTAGADGIVDFVSDQWRTEYGGDPSEMIGEGWIARVHPDDVERTLSNWAAAAHKAETYEAEFRLRLPDGEYRWVLISAKPEVGDDGIICGWFGTCIRIHDRVVAEQRLAQKEELYRSILEASADCIKVIALDGIIELINSPGVQLMEGANADNFVGSSWPEAWSEDMRPTVANALHRAAKGETSRFSGCLSTLTGKQKWWNVVVSPIRDENNVVTSVLAISRDCSEERERSQQLLWASEHDPLTSLPNRRAFQERLKASVLRSMRSGSRIGLLLMDVDHFKYVNDTLGHAAGDRLLREFGKRIRGSLRSDDFVARIGGDEFAIIVENINSAEDLLRIGESAGKVLKAPIRLEGRSVSAGATIGGAMFPMDAQTSNDLFNVADTALYALKTDGRGGTRLFHSRMREESQRVASQLNLARLAIRDRSVVPFFQPKIDLKTNQLVGFEALLRWRDSEHGFQQPQSIEEAFKEYELASEIGTLMQRRVFEQVRRWLDCGADFGRISLNGAPAEFLRDDYAERLLVLLARYDIPASFIEVEVTEHALMDRSSQYVERALTMLKGAGVTVALDDFGTGYSSLSHLRDFPVDVVKVDKSFVQAMNSDSEIAAIVAAVINLSNSLNVQSVAEGIETAEQLTLLRTMGCQVGQGYALGAPVAGDQVAIKRAAKAA